MIVLNKRGVHIFVMKKIALINDLSGFGKCSLTAAIPVISVLGIQACPLPTAILSAQTGFDSYFCDDYTEKMNLFTNEWKKMGVSFDGIYSGFLAGPEQMKKVFYFLEQFKTKENMYMLDPIMGDNGRTIKIFNDDLLRGMQELSLHADVLTPNITELCLLTDVDYGELVCHKNEEDYVKRIQDICETLMKKTDHPQSIVVTGIIHEKNGLTYMGNLVVSETESAHIEKPYVKQRFSGTGDLFASVVCGSLVGGNSLTTSVQKASDFLHTAIEDAAAENVPSNHGIHFEKYLSRLL